MHTGGDGDARYGCRGMHTSTHGLARIHKMRTDCTRIHRGGEGFTAGAEALDDLCDRLDFVNWDRVHVVAEGENAADGSVLGLLGLESW